MNAAARSLEEHAKAVGVAAEQIRADVLAPFRSLSKADPRRAFGHTVRQHRHAIEVCEETLRALCFGGRAIEQQAADLGFANEAIDLIRSAHINLRVMRALAAVLAGERDTLDGETEDVRSKVKQLLDERSAENAENWTAGELEAFREGPRPFTPEFEAWLDRD